MADEQERAANKASANDEMESLELGTLSLTDMNYFPGALKLYDVNKKPIGCLSPKDMIE